MKYYSEVTGAIYNTEEELRAEEMEIARKENEKREQESVRTLCNGNDVLADLYTTNMKVMLFTAITGDTDHGPIKAKMMDGSIKTYGSLYEIMYDLKKRELEMEKKMSEAAEWDDDGDYEEEEEEE